MKNEVGNKSLCDLDIDFLINLFNNQNKKCAVSGIIFNLKNIKNFNKVKRPFAVSVDRIDCDKGYTKENVRLVCVMVNIALNEFGDDLFKEMCLSYVKNNDLI